MKLTQTQRILRLALERGEDGITAVDFQLPDVADGGAPILRVAARIGELEEDGIHFTDGGTRNRCKVYVLDRESLARATKPPTTTFGPPSAASPVPPPQADEGGTGALFQIGRAQQSAIFDADYGDAA